MANHAKNIFVGTGGKEAIDRSHYLGAVCGMEGIMGRADTPVRALLDEALGMAAGKLPPIIWILTVISPAEDGSLALRGYFSSPDRRCFEEAAALSAQVNIQLLDEPVQKAVVWLDPEEYRSTWLGNKSIYRMRMAMADGGELLILAPGLRSFGEDPTIDAVIRRYGYRPSAEIQALVAREPALADNLSAAAHLIHGSSEGRFRISYAPGPSVGKEEIASVGYQWADLDRALERYAPQGRLAGFHKTSDGEDFSSCRILRSGSGRPPHACMAHERSMQRAATYAPASYAEAFIRMLTTRPCPSEGCLFCAAILHPCRSTTNLTIVRPRPYPASCREWVPL